MVRASLPGYRYSSEKYDRTFLPEIFAPCPAVPELSTYRRRRISDRPSLVLQPPSPGEFPVLARQSRQHCGRPWAQRGHFLLLRYKGALVLLHVRLAELRPTIGRQSKSPDPRGNP